MTTNILRIKELDISVIQPNNNTFKDKSQGGFKIVIIGKPGTGKTWLITDLLYKKRRIFPIGMICSGTEDSNHHFSKIFPDSFIFGNLNEQAIENFVDRQKKVRDKVQNPWGVLLLDDCMDDPRVLTKPLFQGIFKNGRHWKMLFILSLQYCLDIRPVIRSNVDGAFILREPNIKNRRSLWENYASIIPTFSMFCNIMDQITDDYTALFILNHTISNEISECIFWYKADKVPPDFKFGCKDMWKHHLQRYHKET